MRSYLPDMAKVQCAKLSAGAMLLATILQTQAWSASGKMLEFSVRPPAEESSPSTPYTLSVYLSPSLLSASALGSRVDRDFSSGRVKRVAIEDKASRDDSIFAPLALRVAELENRKMIDGVMARIGQSPSSPPPAILDHIFSVDSGTSASIDRREQEGRVIFSHGPRILAEYDTEGTAVSSSVMSHLATFLCHEYGLHPKILAEIASLGYIPREIVVCLQEPSESRHTLTLTGVRDSSPPEPMPPLPPPPDRVYGLSARASAMSREEVQARHATILEEATRYADAGRNLDSMLMLLSYGACTGKTPDSLPALKEKIGGDPEVISLLELVNPTDEQSAREALVKLESLGSESEPARAMLKLFQANITAALGNPAAASELFLGALEIEPTMSSAWFDLGAVFHTSFDTHSAWRCYDAGKALSPAHPAAKEIGSVEQGLRTSHPRFFNGLGQPGG